MNLNQIVNDMDERCKVMGVSESEKHFKQTDIALNYCDTLLNIFEYIEAINFKIDKVMLNKFWQCMVKNNCVTITH